MLLARQLKSTAKDGMDVDNLAHNRFEESGKKESSPDLRQMKQFARTVSNQTPQCRLVMLLNKMANLRMIFKCQKLLGAIAITSVPKSTRTPYTKAAAPFI